MNGACTPQKGRGISLAELLIALAIAGILVSIALPGYGAYLTRSRRVEAQVALVEAMQQEERYFSAHNRYAAYSADALTPDTAHFRWHSAATPAGSAYELRAVACPGRELSSCVRIEAMPGTNKVNAGFRDRDCGTMWLDSDGSEGAGGTGKGCWP
jgi:type IV pilus assembly protein PilE